MNRDRIGEVYEGTHGDEHMQLVARERIHWMCSRVRGSEILDVGCSQGIASLLLGREGKTVLGIDREHAALDEAAERLRAEEPEVRRRVRFEFGEATALPVEDGSYDTVLLGELLEHLLDRESVLAEAARVLRPGGAVVITTPYGIHPYPDHKEPLYLRPLLEQLDRAFGVAEISLVDRYLALVAVKDGRREVDWRKALTVAEQRLADQDVRTEEQRRRLVRLQEEVRAAAALREQHDADEERLAALQERLASAEKAAARLRLRETELLEAVAQRHEESRVAAARAEAAEREVAVRTETGERDRELLAERAAELAAARVELSSLRELEQASRRELEELRPRLADAEAELAAARTDAAATAAERDALLRTNAQLSEDVHDRGEAVERLEQVLAAERREREETEARARERLEELRTAGEALAAERRERAEEVERLRAEAAELAGRGEELEDRLRQAEATAQRLERELETAGEETRRGSDAAAARLDALQSASRRLREERDRLSRRVARLSGQQQRLLAHLADLDRFAEERDADLARLDAELEALRAQLALAEAAVAEGQAWAAEAVASARAEGRAHAQLARRLIDVQGRFAARSERVAGFAAGRGARAVGALSAVAPPAILFAALTGAFGAVGYATGDALSSTVALPLAVGGWVAALLLLLVDFASVRVASALALAQPESEADRWEPQPVRALAPPPAPLDLQALRQSYPSVAPAPAVERPSRPARPSLDAVAAELPPVETAVTSAVVAARRQWLAAASRPRVGDLRVAAVLDEMSRACFAPECRLITFGVEDWAEALEREPPDLLLVESAWSGNGGAWQYCVGSYTHPHYKGLPQLRALIAWCRERDIPTVFWNKEDPVHFDRFAEAAALFDHVFTTDANCIPRYEALGGEHVRSVSALPFAAQPQLHNPVRVVAERNPEPVFAGTYYRDRHPARRAGLEAILDAARPFGLIIYDRTFGSDSAAYGFPERFLPHVKGRLPYERIVEVYKSHKLFLNVNSVVDSPTMFSRRVFELLACDTAVLSTGSAGIEEFFGDLVPIANTEEEASGWLTRLLEDEPFRRDLTRRARRLVHTRHNYAERLAAIAATAGIDVSPERESDVSVLLDLIRGDSAPAARLVADLAAQTQRPREVVARLPRGADSAVLDPLRDALGESALKLVESSGEGGWEELAALATAPWVAPTEPGTRYGANHLADLALGTGFAAADGIGAAVGHGMAEQTYAEALDARFAIARRELVAAHGWPGDSAGFERWFRAGRRFYVADAPEPEEP